MSLSDLTSRQPILDAVKEFNELGEASFLSKYGFGKAKRYFLLINGKYYPSKAIFGVAHKYQYPKKGPLKSSEFTGGKHTVKIKLEKLGFDVIVK